MSNDAYHTKDPEAVLDYLVDWSTWMPSGDAITASSWTITGPDSALTLGTGAQAPDNTDTTATMWLVGGTLGQRYQAVNHIVTAQGREDDRTLYISIAEK